MSRYMAVSDRRLTHPLSFFILFCFFDTNVSDFSSSSCFHLCWRFAFSSTCKIVSIVKTQCQRVRVPGWWVYRTTCIYIYGVVKWSVQYCMRTLEIYLEERVNVFPKLTCVLTTHSCKFDVTSTGMTEVCEFICNGTCRLLTHYHNNVQQSRWSLLWVHLQVISTADCCSQSKYHSIFIWLFSLTAAGVPQ